MWHDSLLQRPVPHPAGDASLPRSNPNISTPDKGEHVHVSVWIFSLPPCCEEGGLKWRGSGDQRAGSDASRQLAAPVCCDSCDWTTKEVHQQTHAYSDWQEDVQEISSSLFHLFF